MARMQEHHHTLTHGVGKCSVPMFRMGCPDGFCDRPAYGERPYCRPVWSAGLGRYTRPDGRYDGYVPGLACEAHGGPPARHFGDPCVHCNTPHDDVPVGPCPAYQSARKEAGL